jgi:hypothetical protein
MAFKNIQLSFTVTGGVAGAVSVVGGTADNGTYTIIVKADNNGPDLTCVTPVGTIDKQNNLGLLTGYAGT